METTQVKIKDILPLLDYGPDFEKAVKNTFRAMQLVNNAPGFVYYSLDQDGRLNMTVSENIDEQVVRRGEEIIKMVDDDVIMTTDPHSPLALDKSMICHVWMPLFIDQVMGMPAPGIGIIKIGVMYCPFHNSVTEEQIRGLYIVATQAAMTQINANLVQIWRSTADLSIEQVPVGIITMFWNGTVFSTNQVAKDILGGITGDICFQTGHLKDIWIPLKRAIDQAAKENRVREFELTWRSPDDEARQLKFRVTVDWKDKQFFIATMILEDVTARRRLEQALERGNRLKALSGLVAGAAHEIRNPLAGLKGTVQYLGRDQRLREEKGKYLDLLASEIDRIDGIVENLLAFARPQPPKLEPVQLYDLADSVLLLLESQLDQAGIQVQREYQDMARVLADGEQIRQVLLNLFLNATEVMKEGGILTVIVRPQGDKALISVRDTGAGIPKELLERIWHPFQSGKERGTGLGLSVVHSIIAAHGGEIRASNLSPGACFCIELPREGRIE